MVDATCKYEGCGEPVRARGWCSTHYGRWQTTGSVELSPHCRYMQLPLLERYESRVDRSGGPDACHPWTGPCFPSGYGHFTADGEQRAHRFGYKHLVGPIPKGMHVLHRCDNPPCQNQDHWFLGTHAQNMADRKAKGRYAMPRGEASSNAKLTWAQVAEIRSRSTGKYGEGVAFAREYGVSGAVISAIILGRTWKPT